jgi:tetratricopeptide (TPR) repeat protein
MTTLKFIPAFLLIVLYSCGQKSVRHTPNPEAIKLHNKIIPLVNHLENSDSCKKGLLYLDSATTIDSNCFSCNYEKLMFLSSLNQFDKAVLTINNCIRIRPYAHDLYLTGGLLYARTGDTISAKKYFQKSLEILNPVLDTMKTNDNNYEMLVGNKAVNLLMLGYDKQLDDLLKQLSNSQLDTAITKNILVMRGMNRKVLIIKMTGDKNSR